MKLKSICSIPKRTIATPDIIEYNQTLYLFFCSSTFSNTTLMISNMTSSSLISVNHVTIYVDPSCNLVAFSSANSSFFLSSSALDVISSHDLFTSFCILRNVFATAGSLVSRSLLLVFMMCSYLGARDSTVLANSYDSKEKRTYYAKILRTPVWAKHLWDSKLNTMFFRQIFV